MPRGGFRKGAGRPRGTGPWNEPTELMRVPVSLVPLVKKTLATQRLRLPYTSPLSLEKSKRPENSAMQQSDIFPLIVDRHESTILLCTKKTLKNNNDTHAHDILIVDRRTKPQTGQLVVATANNRTTVGRLKKLKNELVFQPVNPRIGPTKVKSKKEFQIIGVVTKLIRAM